MSTYAVQYLSRPWTTNAERRMHHFARARLVRQWRAYFHSKALQQGIPPLGAVRITVQVHLHRGVLQDTDAASPAVKAAIDGLVSAGVIPDDDPTHLLGVTYLPPLRDPVDSLTLTIEGVTP